MVISKHFLPKKIFGKTSIHQPEHLLHDDNCYVVGDDPHFDYASVEIKETTQTPPPSPKEDENVSKENVPSESVLQAAVKNLVVTNISDPVTPPSSPSYLPGREEDSCPFYPLATCDSTDSAVEATEEVLENMEGKINEEEKENIEVTVSEEKNNVEMESICDKVCESEKISDLATSPALCPKLDEVGDRRNLAEIKIQ